MIKQQLFIGAALIAGVAAGYFLRGENTESSAAAAKPRVQRGKIAESADSAQVAALRRRVAELEKLLAKDRPAAVENAEKVDGPEPQVAAKPPEPPRPGNPRQWMEDLKKNDPGRYVQITNNVAQWRRRSLDRAQSRLEYLSSVDVSGMSEEARKNHERLQDLIERRAELGESVHDENLSDEERHKLFEAMHACDREMRQVNAVERRNLIVEAAKSFGFADKDADGVADTLQQVIDVTDTGMGWHRGPHGGGRR